MKSERVEVRLTLKLTDSVDERFAVSWNVTATALVRHDRGTWDQPRDLLIEDIEVSTIHHTIMTVGNSVRQLPDDSDSFRQRLHEQQQVAWLNEQLDDRDDWREAIEQAAMNAAQSELAAA